MPADRMARVRGRMDELGVDVLLLSIGADLPWLTGYEDGPPIRSGISYGDPIAGLYGAIGVLTALLAREATGAGQRVEVAQTEGLAALIADAIAEGRAPIGVNLQMLMDGRLELAPCWSEQRRMFSGADSRSQLPDGS